MGPGAANTVDTAVTIFFGSVGALTFICFIAWAVVDFPTPESWRSRRSKSVTSLWPGGRDQVSGISHPYTLPLLGITVDSQDRVKQRKAACKQP